MAIRIVVDAMGGDFAPQEIIKGSVHALRKHKDIQIIFVGDQSKINPLLEKEECEKNIDIVHTPDFITMDESPKHAVADKPKASINVAMEILNSSGADALVSAGNTGATVLSAAKYLTMIPGIERSGLATIYPTAKLHPSNHGISLMIDVGATLHCTAKQLVHFAYMGS